MNPNLPPLGKYSNKVIDRDALNAAFGVPAGFNDQQTNFWLANSRPGGIGDYESPDALDMDLLRSLMANGRDASIEALNESLDKTAAVMAGGRSPDEPAPASPVVAAQAKPAIIGLSASTLAFRNEVAARLRAAGY